MSRLMERLKQNSGMNAQMVAAQRTAMGGFAKDERIWKHVFDAKTKISSNIIRFLPTPECDFVAQEKGEIPADFPLAPVSLVLRHGFKGSAGRYYNAISPATWGHTCPVREYDRPNWDRQKELDDKALKEVLKKRIPSTEYYANILVINDAQNPENNGKVFLIKFGNGLKKVLDAAGAPKFPSDPVIADPFCPFTGANLVYDFEGEERTIGDWTGLVAKDFGRCKWQQPSRLAETDEEIEQICSKAYSLFDFVDPRKEEPYDVLEKRFKEAMGIPVDQDLMSHKPIHEDNGGAGVNAAEMARKALEEAEKKAQTPSSNAGQQNNGGQDQSSNQSQNKTGGMVDADFENFLAELENGN